MRERIELAAVTIALLFAALVVYGWLDRVHTVRRGTATTAAFLTYMEGQDGG